MTTRDDYAASLRRRWENTPPPEGTTEPPVECVAVDRDERCLCPGGPASHRPSPPAAGDDAVAAWQARAEQIIDERTAERDRWRNIAESNAERLAARTTEVERLADLLHTVANDATARDARAEAAEAEVERLTDLLHTVTNDATARDARREVAERQVADLRAGIEALPHLTVNTDGGRMTVVRVDDLNRALLAGSGEQPGPLKAGVMALTGLSSDEVDALGGVREDDRPAPAVPDSTGLRERLWEAIVKVRDAAPRLPDDADTDDIVDAVLAVVGQGVTAVPWGDPPDNWCLRHEQPRWVCRSSRVQGACEAGLWPTLYRAVVRSGEKGGEDRG